MEFVLKMEEFLAFALHHTGDGYSGPTGHHVGDVVGRHLLFYHGFRTLAFVEFLFEGEDALFEFLETSVADFRHTPEVTFALGTFGIELQGLDDFLLLLYLLQQRPLALPLLLEGTLLFAECMDFLVKLRKFCGVRFLSSGICCRFLLAADGLALDFKLTQTA